MANDFYNRGASFNPDELADGDAIEAEFDAVSRGFDIIEDLVNANKAGYPTQTFYVAPAVENTHAIQKSQLDSAVSQLNSNISLKLNSASYTASDVLLKLKTVDGSGSGLDADLLDGLHASSFLRSDLASTALYAITLAGGVSTAGNDVYIGNGAIITSDADGEFSARGGTNIDHIWHDDSTNTWHFCSDTTYKATGNAIVKAATFSGNAETATTLKTARSINGISFNGSADVTVEPYVEQDLSTAATRYLTFVDSSTAGYQRLNLDDTLTYNPSTNLLGASVSGNAGTASKLQTARTISLTSGATGSTTFDGSGNASIAVTVSPTGHVHALRTISDSPYKEAADCATTAALTVTATTTTLTNAGTLAALVIDGVTVTTGMRVLVKDQATSAQNGIYDVTNAGSSSVAWVLTRSSDADTSAEIAGAVITVDQGTVNGACLFTNDFKKTSTLGTSSMNWRAVIDAGNIGNYNSGTATKVSATATGTNSADLVTGTMADNDKFRIRIGGSAVDSGWVELATADNGNEPIYVRQYNGDFDVVTRTLILLDASGNSVFPGTITAPTFSGALSGNASTASTLQTARAINGVSFNGSANITVEPYVETDSTAASRYVTFVDSGTAGFQRLNMDGGLTYNPSTNILTTSVSGNASSATKLATARTIALSGDAGGSASFDGSANATISVNLTNSSVMAIAAAGAAGGVGTYVFGYINNTAAFAEGVTYAGSSIKPAAIQKTLAAATVYGGYRSASTLSGTWRAMGAAGSIYECNFTLFLRIS